ncbi:SusC/RagA family TonB-linked outer membrane protein [Pedobacter gandavensis]|uniref:SusC/RagA family TonB-linked outer membrane protein n=1 Tax=Pedobacter gandavensis TaxID=2679963 RepID=UPI00292E7270|nr:SusC/RagA family TonB-linked outer membrane protein [Pedobacter gandavensis]
MKLIILLLIASILQVSANTFAQKISIDKKNADLKSVINEIRAQSGYDFFYDKEVIKEARPVTIKFKNIDLSEALVRIFKDQPISYTLAEADRAIILNERTKIVVKRNVDLGINIDVSGKVVDENGQALPGATVRIKGTSTVVTTDINGMFSLKNVKENDLILVNFLGFKEKELKASANLGTIGMTMNVANLEEVLVVSTGYQNLAKERVTGSFGSVTKAQLEKPSVNIAQRLIGTNAGVQALSMDADGNPMFEIRGQSTLYNPSYDANTNKREVLVVVDGFPVQGGLASINPNDVESVTILKDAAAASIWGARSANGVIVVTTKKGKQGGLKVEFSAFTRVGAKLDLDYVNPKASSAETVDYTKYSFDRNTFFVNSGVLESNYYYNYTPAQVALNEHKLGFLTTQQKDAELARLATLDNRQQIKDLLLENPLNQQYNLTLSGATQRMNNMVSMLFEKNQSNFKNTGNKKYMLNWRNNSNLTSWLDLNLSAMLQHGDYTNNGVVLGGVSKPMTINPFIPFSSTSIVANPDIQSLAPFEMLQNPDGSFTDIGSEFYNPVIDRFIRKDLFPYSDWSYNPAREINSRDITTKDYTTRLQAGLRIKLLEGLTFEPKVQLERYVANNRALYGEDSYTTRTIVNTAAAYNPATMNTAPILNIPKGSILDQSKSQYTVWSFRTQLAYDRRFGTDHEINAVAGTETYDRKAETFSSPRAFGFNKTTNQVGIYPNGTGSAAVPLKNFLNSSQAILGYTNGFGYVRERTFSGYANASYTYKSKYTVSGSARFDAANYITDDPKYRYNPFWSVGGAWNVGKEEFIAAKDWIDALVIRTTFGYNGNVDRGTSFKPLISVGGSPNTYTNEYVAYLASLGNPMLRWEKTGILNAAVDFSFFKGKLFGKVDFYNKNSKDLIASVSIPSVNGSTTQRFNAAKLNNRGIEIELGTVQKLSKDLTWTGNVNLSYNYNKITDLYLVYQSPINMTYSATDPSSTSSGWVQGHNANALWLHKYVGIQNGAPAVAGADGQYQNLISYYPANWNGPDFLEDYGTKVAPYTLGLINSFNYKNFNLSFIITGKMGHKFLRTGFDYPVQWSGTRVLPNKYLGEVLNADPSAIVPLPANDESEMYNYENYTPMMNYLLQSATHFRLQEVNLTYKLPALALKKMGLNGACIYIQGNDLLTVVANDFKEDPEYQYGTLKPSPKTTLGIKFDF